MFRRVANGRLAAEVRLPPGSLGQGLRVLSLGTARGKASGLGVVHRDISAMFSPALVLLLRLTVGPFLLFRSSRMDLAPRKRRRTARR